MSQWNHNKLTKEELEAEWKLNFLSEYAELKLLRENGNAIKTYLIENDKRRSPTVRKFFKKLGWVNHVSYCDILTPNDDAIEKVLPDYAEEYQFRVDGKKGAQYGSTNTKVLNNTYEAFMRISRLKWVSDEGRRGLIYIYLHKDEYSFQKKTLKNGRTDTYTYPKKLLDVCDNNILRAHAEKYCLDNPNEILCQVFHLKFRYIGSALSTYSFDEDNKEITSNDFSNSFAIVEGHTKSCPGMENTSKNHFSIRRQRKI